MKPEQRARVLLGDMINVCETCQKVPKKRGNQVDTDYCRNQCTHWQDMQKVMGFIKNIQKERRLDKGLPIND
jgi:hypothetical protein